MDQEAKIQRAKKIKETLQSPGWRDIEEIFQARIEGARERLLAMMLNRPSDLDKKTALRLGLEAVVVKQLLEEIEGEIQILASNP